MRDLTRRNDPFDWIDDMRRTFEGFLGDVPATRAGGPAVDVREEEDKYTLEADLPGMTQDDVDLHIENNVLTLKSSHEHEEEKEEKGYLVRERRSSSFTRSFPLPKGVDQDKIDATFKNGVLTVTMPKSEEQAGRRIDIKKG
ncbi:MAG: Hsp20/alpha crystallin family protein [Spirochaetaceae bacterium]